MQEREYFAEQMKELYLQTYLRIRGLEKELPHAPGCLVQKGRHKKYTYWQVWEDGRQQQRYVCREEVEDTRKRLALLQDRWARLQELRQFIKELDRLLRVLGLSGRDILTAYQDKRTERKSEALGRAAAQKVASVKKYAENYKHMTDKGDLVASKSEEIIANTMFAYGVRYLYEYTLKVGEVVLHPDFVAWRADGTMVVWEHAGLLDDPDYRRQFERKLELYRQAGFTQMTNLIVTYDDNGTFSAATARRMIEAYGLV